MHRPAREPPLCAAITTQLLISCSAQIWMIGSAVTRLCDQIIDGKITQARQIFPASGQSSGMVMENLSVTDFGCAFVESVISTRNV